LNSDSPLRLRRNDVVLGYTLLRIVLGVNFFNHGFTRLNDLTGFSQSMIELFAKTAAPSWLVGAIGFCVPIVELVVGALVTVGWRTRPALVTGFGLMIVLMYGVTLLQNWDAATSQLIYCLIFFILISLHSFNDISIDNLQKRRHAIARQKKQDRPIPQTFP
jgi:thiosulfate dehydrogenase [quinone] large subunit